MNKIGSFMLAATLAGGMSLAQTATQDSKAAGHDTAAATKETGHAFSTGTKTTYRKSKHGTKKVIHKTADCTKTDTKDT